MAHISSLIRVSTLAAIVAGFGLLSTAAEAGFEWKPGPKAGSPEAAVLAPANTDIPPLPPMPSETVDSDTLMKMPVPPLPPLPSASLLGDASSPMPRTGSGLPDAVGFGSDLPLALGMRQIVPAQYAYAFDAGVDQGAKISWNGGKPWDMVLNDAVKPLGYSVVIEGNTVRVASGGANVPYTKSEATPAAPVTMPNMMRVGGDVPRAPLSPASSAQTPIITAGKPVHEVYIRRNASGTESDTGAAGGKSATMSQTGNDGNNSDEKSGFWNSVNPMNWQQDTGNKPSPYAVNRVAGTVSTSKEVPQPASYGASPDVGPVARMSGNDARVDATKEPIDKTPIPNAPDAVADMVPASGAPAGAPVMLTRGAGEISPPAVYTPAAPMMTAEKESVFDNKTTSQAAAVLNTTDIGMWEAKKGDSLKTVLQNWSEKAQVQLYWVPAQDYKLPKPVHMQGNYTDAVADVLGAYGDKGTRPVGRLHPNLPNGPSVLIIEPAAS